MAANNLPIYKLEIESDLSSDSEVDFISLVDAPAIQKDFLAFKEQRQFEFAINDDRHIISGPAMLSDTPIYRRDEKNGEFMVVFDAPTIYQIAQKFFAKGYNQNFNLMHDQDLKTQGICIFESFIVDDSRGIKPMKGFEDAPQGSWFISAHVNNPQVWQFIKEGKVKGFSVEGLFKYAKKQMSDEQRLSEIMKILSES